MTSTPMHRSLWISLCLVAGCSSPTPEPRFPTPVNATNHTWFPITAGTRHEFGKTLAVDGPVTCDSCHRPTADSFTRVKCDQCHKHTEALTQRLHLGVTDFAIDPGTETNPDVLAELRGAGCYRCHPAGEPVAFSHTGITGECSQCHAETNAFAALPKSGFTHRDIGASDCGNCHHDVTNWAVADAVATASDPAQNVDLTALMPTFTATTITRVTPLAQSLPMPMNHGALALDAGVLTDCAACHSEANAGVYYPGLMHSSLAGIGEAQPQRCNECHTTSQPQGFVGVVATAPARTPPTGEMRHDAVGWTNGTPGTTRLVTQDCATCHRTPDAVFATTWGVVSEDGGRPRFHAPLTAAGQAQPTSCLDCHANTRPTVPLTSMNAAVVAGMTFDHGAGNALDDCAGCHASTSTWVGGTFHHAGAPAPTSCLPCHQQERPTSTTGWQSTTYTRSPFDYGTNAQGVTHGGGEDCAVCHAGSTSTWVGGHFPHGVGTLATTTCIACHTTQRPAMVVSGFDHSLNGTGDCRACHQATVRAGRYVDYFNPATNMLPGGDWKDGASYPGDVVVTSPTQFVALTAYLLQRNGTGFVTGMTSQNTQLFNAMLHTSAAIPAQLNPGSATMPDNTTCWHCHTNAGTTTVTSFADGKYHHALTTFAATPGGAVTPLPQPTSRCRDCHEQMRPNMIVQKGTAALQPMDHSATFTAAVTIGGQSVTGVAAIDCSTCHKAPGVSWNDGKFHANIGAAVPTDCVSCHYPLMITASADVTSTTTFAMKHRSTQLTVQKCDTCHTTALMSGSTLPVAATLWRTGTLHPHVTNTALTSCVDCHALSEPTAATQGTTVYTLSQGGTATNGAQWMNHTNANAVGRDCVVCHTNDAKTSGSAWQKSTSFHAKVTAPTSCTGCHGTGNGKGTVIGTNNNLPTGNTNSRTTTTASTSPGVKDQVNHADVNVTGHDCNFCHTQKGTSTMSGVMGQEWKQAQFHRNFTAASPLVMNTTTGRCSTCHFALKPGPSFTTFDHSTYTNTSGTPDCSSCHSWPGTSTTTPNWLGAAAMPAFIAVGGFTVPVPPATAANTLQSGIANLPHPPVAMGVACTTCHAQAAGGRRAFGFPHTNALVKTNCNSCHEAGSDLIGTLWNGSTTVSGGAGDSRPFTLTSVTPTFKGNNRACAYPKHFYPVDCKECHTVPAGNGFVTTGTAYTTVWKFKHSEGAPMTRPSTCNMCHAGTCNIPD